MIAGRVTTDSSVALEALLTDPDVTRVTVSVRRVDVERKGASSPHDGFDFATEDGLVRALARTCERGGLKLDESSSYTRGTLSDGWDLFVVRPPAAPNGHLVQLTRLGSAAPKLDDIVKQGWLSKNMSKLIAKVVQARANVLVVSERDDDADTFVRAIGMVSDAPPLWILRPRDVAPKGHPALALDVDAPGATLDTCAELAVERVMMPKLRLDAWHALLRTVRRGRDGVVARLNGPTVAMGIERTASGLAAYIGEQQQGSTSSIASVATFRAWLSASFPLAIEVGRIRDGAPRVLRMCELSAENVTELFSFEPDPPPAGTFTKTGQPGELDRLLTTRGFGKKK